MYTPIRYVTFHFRDRRGTVSLRYRIRAEITAVLICVQKPYPEYGFRATKTALNFTGLALTFETGWCFVLSGNDKWNWMVFLLLFLVENSLIEVWNERGAYFWCLIGQRVLESCLIFPHPKFPPGLPAGFLLVTCFLIITFLILATICNLSLVESCKEKFIQVKIL